MKKNNVDYLEVRKATDRAAYCIDMRDYHGMIETFEKYKNIQITDMIDEKGYSLLHSACFKNMEEHAIKIVEQVY